MSTLFLFLFLFGDWNQPLTLPKEELAEFFAVRFDNAGLPPYI
jgi:hypothetical protein